MNGKTLASVKRRLVEETTTTGQGQQKGPKVETVEDCDSPAPKWLKLL